MTWVRIAVTVGPSCRPLHGLEEARDLRLDDRLGLRRLALPALEVLGGLLLQIVDVGDVDALELGHRRLDVAGHGDVDEEERAPAARALHAREQVARQHGPLRPRRRDDDVGLAERARQIVPVVRRRRSKRAASSSARARVRFVTVSVGAARAQRARREVGHLARRPRRARACRGSRRRRCARPRRPRS